MNIEIEDGDKFRLKLFSYGYESCSPDKKCFDVKRSRFILHFVIYGKGKLKFCEDQSAVMGRGDVFLLYADEKYSYEPDEKDPWTYSWITVDGENLEKLFYNCGFTKEKPYIRLKDFDSIAKDLRKLTDAYGVNISYDFERTAYLLLLISKMIQRNDSKINSNEEKLRKKRSFRMVVSYIRDNYMLDLDVGRIASGTFFSESYIKHLFREMANMSVTEFLNQYRISKACAILNQSPDAKFAQVAKEVGYENYPYFVRLFTKYQTMSPSEYMRTENHDDPFAWVRNIMLMIFDKEEIDWL